MKYRLAWREEDKHGEYPLRMKDFNTYDKARKYMLRRARTADMYEVSIRMVEE